MFISATFKFPAGFLTIRKEAFGVNLAEIREKRKLVLQAPTYHREIYALEKGINSRKSTADFVVLQPQHIVNIPMMFSLRRWISAEFQIIICILCNGKHMKKGKEMSPAWALMGKSEFLFEACRAKDVHFFRLARLHITLPVLYWVRNAAALKLSD
jgi:hypothetical protein